MMCKSNASMLIKTLIMQQLPFGQNMYYLDKGFVLIQIYLVNKCKNHFNEY